MSKTKPTPEADKPKAEKPPKRGESPEEIVKLLTQIEKAEKAVQVAEIELDSRKEAAKVAKAEWMVKVGELRSLARTRERWAAEAKRQPLLHPKPDKAATLPDGAVSSKRIGMLRDVVRLDGKAAAVTGQEHTAYVDAKGDTFLLVDGNTIDLNPEDWTEIVDDKTEHPLLDQAEKADPGSEAWKLHKLAVLKSKLTETAFDALESTGLPTLGDLQAKMTQHGGFWNRELGIHGRHKEPIERVFTDWVTANS